MEQQKRQRRRQNALWLVLAFGALAATQAVSLAFRWDGGAADFVVVLSVSIGVIVVLVGASVGLLRWTQSRTQRKNPASLYLSYVQDADHPQSATWAGADTHGLWLLGGWIPPLKVRRMIPWNYIASAHVGRFPIGLMTKTGAIVTLTTGESIDLIIPTSTWLRASEPRAQEFVELVMRHRTGHLPLDGGMPMEH